MHRSPREIFRTNLYVGASFMSNREAKMFVDLGFEDRAMWGSDYPHIEGTWPWTLRSLRNTFDGVAVQNVRKMLSENAAAAYGFDLDELRTVSDRIGPRVLDVLEPSTEPLPELRYTLAFRHSGAWS